ncbi:MAG: ATP synthase F1 subunit delta, partial [Chloroflexi bacterium]|nr:ATP synthase F1 subunit delta [Chloroflexota bacterium]
MAVSTFARRYAEAVFDIAAARKEEDRWGDELARIAATLQDRALDAVLGSPRVPFDVKQELVREALPGLSNLALNLVYLLVKKGKNYLAPAIAAEYRRLHDYYHGIEHAEVTSAFPLDEAEREALARRLGAV